MPGCTSLHLLAAVLSVSMASDGAFEVVVVPSNPQVNQSVLFNVMGITERLRFSEWYQGEGIPATNQIIRYNNGDNSISQGTKFFEGVEIHSNGSLKISSVTKEMAGPYTVNIQGFTNPYQKTVSLTVNDPPGSPGSDRESKLSAGTIAGICIGVLAVVAAVIGGGIYFQKSKDSGPL